MSKKVAPAAVSLRRQMAHNARMQAARAIAGTDGGADNRAPVRQRSAAQRIVSLRAWRETTEE